MSKRNENRPGYKKTSVGWIPIEWKQTTLNSVAKLERGKFSVRPRNDPRYYGGRIPFVQTGDVSSANKYIEFHSQTLNSEGLKVSKVFLEGTILITIAANIGDVALVKYKLACPDSLVGILTKEMIDNIWLYYQIKTQKRKLAALAPQNAQKNLNLIILSHFPIPLPSFVEQKKIAEIMSAWDRAIEQTRKLIEAKRRLKKGLMQQLLTGRMRFPEFGLPAKDGELSEGWKEVRLDDVTKILFSGVDKKKYEGQRNIRLCNYMNVYHNDYIHSGMEFMESTASELEISKFNLHKGDIIITKDSETPDDIGNPAVVKDYLNDVICGYHLALIRPYPDIVDSIFLSKQIGIDFVANQFSKLANGATRFGLSVSSVKSVQVLIPSIVEQRIVGNFAYQLDYEIDLLKKREKLLDEQKKGLMQKLLTGEVRVSPYDK